MRAVFYGKAMKGFKTSEYSSVVAGVPVTIKKKRVKTLRIYVYPDGRVVVSAPFYLSEERIFSFITERAGWINKKRAEFSAVGELCSGTDGENGVRARRYASGEAFYFLGEKYTLVVREYGAAGGNINADGSGGERARRGRKNAVTADGSEVVLTVKAGATFEEKERVINAFYKRELEKTAGKLLKECEELTGLNSSGFGIRNMRTRWGSCNVKTHRITFNLQLAKVPSRLIEYVVLHEVLHIKIPNHGKGFKALLSLYMPDWKERRKELSSCGRAYAFK